MTIFSRKLFLLLFSLILSNIFPLAVTQPIYTCFNNGNYTSNSTYRKNLNTLLSSIPSNVDKYGFYINYAGTNSDRVYATALCRGDIQPDTCRNCINETANLLVSELCPGYKEAITYPDKCTVGYSTKNTRGELTDSPVVAALNTRDAQSGDQFNQALRSLMESLRDKASSGSHLKFAVDDAPGPDFLTIYGLVQCTPDLSEGQCKDCLGGIIGDIGWCCSKKVGARIVYPSCNLRYEVNPFYNETAVVVDVPPPETPSNQIPPPSDTGFVVEAKKSNSIRTVLISVGAALIVLVAFIFLLLFLWRTKHKKQNHEVERKRENQEIHLLQLTRGSSGDQYQGGNLLGEEGTESQDFPSIKFDIICSATNQFSNENKLGQGGFGPVYKGILPDGKAIAVKRLSKTSGQGLQEFRNEISLIARLQHRNLVRLVGCCLEGNELLLIYEYMPNKSLDFFLFDSNKSAKLDWTRRFIIIKGIARGTLYLHEDSRLRIIHRDLKASNVLLDQEMNPKISDFGLARIFGVNQDEANTNRVVGTYGYMAPEYAMEGLFSVKSDVFSFGVLLLEIISGKKNSGFYVNEHGHNLLSFAWELWSNGRGLELLDPLEVHPYWTVVCPG